MKKSAAYLLGVQQGLGTDLELEKIAQFVSVLESASPHQKEAMLKWLASLLRSISKPAPVKRTVSKAVPKGKINLNRPVGKSAPATGPSIGRVRYGGEQGAQIMVPGIKQGPSRTQRVEQRAKGVPRKKTSS